MKIAFFHHLPSGGALKLVAPSARQLVERGHDVRLFTFSSAERAFAPWPWPDREDVEPLTLGGASQWQRYRRATAAIAERIARWQPDAVWVEKCRAYGHPPLLGELKARGVHTVLHTHEPLRAWGNERLGMGVGVSNPNLTQGVAGVAPSARRSIGDLVSTALRAPSSLYRLRVDRQAVAAADHVMTSSVFTQEWLWLAYGVRASVLGPGVDLAYWKPAVSVGRERRVLSVGRLDPIKGHGVVLRVLAAMPEAERPAWDLVCDDIAPEMAAWLAAEAARAGVAYTLHHRIGEDVLRDLYRRARAVVCAAEREPFGLVPVEAMACATPVLAVREGGFAETVSDHETGFLVERSADVSVWVERLRRLLDDDVLVALMGADGVARVQGRWAAADWVERARAASGLDL